MPTDGNRCGAAGRTLPGTNRSVGPGLGPCSVVTDLWIQVTCEDTLGTGSFPGDVEV